MIYGISRSRDGHLGEIRWIDELDDYVSIHFATFGRMRHEVADRYGVALVDIDKPTAVVAFTAGESAGVFGSKKSPVSGSISRVISS
jgi:hypothetical protein